MPDTIRSDRREVAIGLHAEKRLDEAEFFRAVARAFLEMTEAMAFPIDYIEGYDHDDIVNMLKACARFSRAWVEDIAQEDVLAMVNEGTM